MTRFADELRGSEGERCLVIYPYNPYRVGEIIEATPDGTAVVVRFENGETERCGYGRVTLVDEESPL